MKDAQINEAYGLIKEAPTAENYTKLANLLPAEQAKSIREGFTLLEEDRQKALLSESANVFAAFASNQPEIGIKFLEDKLEAYKNAGNEKGVRDTQMLVDLAKTGPMGQEAVQNIFGLTISQMPNGKEAIEGVAKHNEDWRAQDLHSLNKAKLQAEIDAFDEKKKAGGLSSKDVSDLEVQLNNSVNTRLTGVRTASTLYENIKASAEMGQGEGDRALVNMFSRMLSPGIVTASDYAAATSSGGIMGEFSVLKDKVATGDLLTPKQREKFVKLAKEFYENAKKESDQQLTGINSIVKTRGLNKNNVFGTPKESEPVEVVKVSGDR